MKDEIMDLSYNPSLASFVDQKSYLCYFLPKYFHRNPIRGTKVDKLTDNMDPPKRRPLQGGPGDPDKRRPI